MLQFAQPIPGVPGVGPGLVQEAEEFFPCAPGETRGHFLPPGRKLIIDPGHGGVRGLRQGVIQLALKPLRTIHIKGQHPGVLRGHAGNVGQHRMVAVEGFRHVRHGIISLAHNCRVAVVVAGAGQVVLQPICPIHQGERRTGVPLPQHRQAGGRLHHEPLLAGALLDHERTVLQVIQRHRLAGGVTDHHLHHGFLPVEAVLNVLGHPLGHGVGQGLLPHGGGTHHGKEEFLQEGPHRGEPFLPDSALIILRHHCAQ